MRLIAARLIVLALMMNAGTALAAEPEDGRAAARVGSTDDIAGDPDRKICHVERTIGSNLAHKVCRTVAQLERERELSREGLSKAQQLR